jgi:hypothetical protein
MFVAVSIVGVFLNIFAYPILNRWNEGARESCSITQGFPEGANYDSVLVHNQCCGDQHRAFVYFSKD